MEYYSVVGKNQLSSLEKTDKFFSDLFLNLFIYYFWLCWVFFAMCGLSLVVASGGYSLLWRAGFSLRRLLFVAEHGL